MQAHAGQEPHTQMPLWKPENGTNTVSRLDSSSNKHWPVPINQLQCRVCSAYSVMRKVSVKRQECEVGLCVDKTYFLDYHTIAKL
jgi:hypothetical protein